MSRGEKMKVLIVGSGGREHTLAWKIKQSPLLEELYVAPGNAGTAKIAKNVDISAEDIQGVINFAKEKQIDMVVVGPEVPLVEGIVDSLEAEGIKAFGPSKAAAILEGSKIFTRELLQKYNIPSAEFASFGNAEEAIAYVEEKGAPIVVKADGLAAGKGAIVCETKEEAKDAINKILVDKEFGDAGNEVIIEEKLIGEEASYLIFTDGKTILPMVSSQDHKAVFDGDKGPNTGGMGAYSPAPIVTTEVEKVVLEKIMRPMIDAMEKEGRTYKGILYAGLMITKNGPRIIEFNCRFGDPETQVILPRLESDLLPIMQGCIEGNLAEKEVKWKTDACTCVVLASGGYPGKYEKGKEINGLENVANAVVFHAGTKEVDGKTLTNGGRVLGVSALGESIATSIDQAYVGVKQLSFEGIYYRKDIGQKALK